MSTPIRRSFDCCARASRGQTTGAPLSSVMNSRRLMLNLPLPESVHRTLSLPQSGRRVLWADLNCSERVWLLPPHLTPQLGEASTIPAGEPLRPFGALHKISLFLGKTRGAGQ